MFWERWPPPRPRGQRTGGRFPTIPAQELGWGWGGAPIPEHLLDAGALPHSLSVFKMTDGIKLFIQIRQWGEGGKVTAARSRASKPRTLWVPKSTRQK